MRRTVLRKTAILLGVVIGLMILFVLGVLVYYRYFAFVPDKGGMEATCFRLEVTPYNGGTDESGKAVGYGEGESRHYEIYNGDLFYECYDDTLVQNPQESDISGLIGLLFQVVSLDADSATLLVNQEERTVMYGEEFTVHSLIDVHDGASTSYRVQITP